MTSWLTTGLHNLYSQHPVFESTDPMMTKEETAEVLTEHRLTWEPGEVDSSLRCAQVGQLSFIVLRYGAAVYISPEALQDFYLFQVPVRGKSAIHVGQHTVAADRSTATIISPHLSLQLDWEQNCEQFLVKIPKQLMNQACMPLLGTTPEEPIHFHPQYSITDPNGIAWLHQMGSLLSYANQCSTPPTQWLKNHEQNALQHLLLTQPNNYSHYFQHEQRLLGQRRVRLAKQYIAQHLGEKLQLDDIANACNSSVRSLTHAFKQQHNISLTHYIRNERLKAVRQELLQPTGNARVTEIATKWGFTHLGRFSAWYKDAYQESPSETLRPPVTLI